MSYAFTNRFGSNRAMYTLVDPMNAGAWAWFTGITLILLSPLAKLKRWQNAAFVIIGMLSISTIVMTLSRGPAIVAVLSLLALVPCLLHTARGRLLALLSVAGTLTVIRLSIFVFYIFDPPLFDSIQQLGSVAFSKDEEGNSDRIDMWTVGARTFGELRWTGAGLHTIAFLWDQTEVNLEDTYLTIMYATGIPGLIYSIIFVIAWIVQTYRLGVHLYFTRDRSPQRLLCLAWAAGWLPFTFIFPCFRTVECSFITCSILASLLFFDRLRDRDVEIPESLPMRRHLSIV